MYIQRVLMRKTDEYIIDCQRIMRFYSCRSPKCRSRIFCQRVCESRTSEKILVEPTPTRDVKIANHQDQRICGLRSNCFCQLLQLLFFHAGVHPMPRPVSCEIREDMGIENNDRDISPS